MSAHCRKNDPATRIAGRLRDRKTPLGAKVIRALLGAYAAVNDENKRAIEADEVGVIAQGGGKLNELNAAVVRIERHSKV